MKSIFKIMVLQGVILFSGLSFIDIAAAQKSIYQKDRDMMYQKEAASQYYGGATTGYQAGSDYGKMGAIRRPGYSAAQGYQAGTQGSTSSDYYPATRSYSPSEGGTTGYEATMGYGGQ